MEGILILANITKQVLDYRPRRITVVLILVLDDDDKLQIYELNL
jgi:hypothetical protein